MRAMEKHPPVSRLTALNQGYRLAANNIRSINARMPILEEIVATESRINALTRQVEQGNDPRIVVLLHEKVDQGLKNINAMLRPHIEEIAKNLLDGVPEAAVKIAIPELKFKVWISPGIRQSIETMTAKINDRLAEIVAWANKNEGNIHELGITVGRKAGRGDKKPYDNIRELEAAVQKFGDRMVAKAQNAVVYPRLIRLSLEKFYLGLWEKGDRRAIP